jgi:hypothetical protein
MVPGRLFYCTFRIADRIKRPPSMLLLVKALDLESVS